MLDQVGPTFTRHHVATARALWAPITRYVSCVVSIRLGCQGSDGEPNRGPDEGMLPRDDPGLNHRPGVTFCLRHGHAA